MEIPADEPVMFTCFSLSLCTGTEMTKKYFLFIEKGTDYLSQNKMIDGTIIAVLKDSTKQFKAVWTKLPNMEDKSLITSSNLLGL